MTVNMRVAMVQMTSTQHVEDNVRHVLHAIAKAASDGAHWVILPENFAAFGVNNYREIAAAEGSNFNGPILSRIRQCAAKEGVWVCAGTLPLETGQGGRPATATLIIDPQGRVIARYQKVHLFDAQVADRQRQYRESDSYAPGRGLCVIATAFGRIGVAVCYDLRFPEMFLAYRRLGVSMVLVPSAFTHTTGKAHWECLIRARAIENGFFIVAANQGGKHWNNRETWGHSMAVDPWGTVLHQANESPQVQVVEINLSDSHRIRQAIPTQWHREQRLARNLSW